MRDPAAGLLMIFLWGILCATFHPTFVSSTLHPSSDVGPKNLIQNQSSSESHLNRVDETSTIGLPNYARPVINPKELLLQEIRTLDENVKMQEEVAKTIIKAGAQKSKPHSTIPPRLSKKPINLKTNTGKKTTPPLLSKIAHITTPATVVSTKVVNHTDSNDQAMKKLLEAEDMGYDDDDDDEDDRSEEDDDEEDDEDDEYDDDDDDEDEDLTEDEEVMTQCPDYCRCSGQYASATTARCTKLVDEQNFGTGIAHLCIENAGEIRLGPYALRDRGLQQLESITFADTRIIEMDRTAFDGITYLFAVNLTRNALLDIHPQMFQNNSQLSLLTISGNPLKHNQYFKPNRHSILDAPSVTQFDFSGNGVTRLPRTAFSSMTSLAYISLRDNRLKEIERDLFRPLEALVELDLSNNLLNDLPDDLFKGSGLQTLRVSGNNLTTLATIIASNLTTLEAANNRIRYIAKEDLASLPELDRLVIRSNGMKRIHQHAFSNLDQLLYLDISDNKLTSLTEHHLRTNPRLQVLLMNDNPGLESLPVFKTAGLEYDTFSVYRFECANCGLNNLAKGTFNAMPALTRLNLARNRLTGLPDGLLSQLSSLRELDLSDNIIDTLGVNMFHGTTSLTKLNLAGNPLVTLQVSAFLGTPSLTRIDVSRCALERVWSEARAPLKSLRFLSVRGNLLRRITVEELKAMPNLSGLDLSHNPLECNDEFHSAVHWLSEHGVTPTETLKYFNDFIDSGNYVEIDGTTEWSDFVNIICNEDDGPPPRPVPHKPNDNHVKLETNDPALKKNIEDEITFSFQFNHGIRHNERIEDTWTNQNQEYEDFASIQQEDYRPWYYGAVWPVITIILITLAVLLLIAHCAVCMSKQRGRGPVIRPPMMLRPGLIDNKNCGLVYKPLHEEIPTPHMPKRGSFYSSSTFHYDKIVPESV